MSCDHVIIVEDLEKSYRLYPTPFDRIREAASLTRRSFHTKFCALKGISFEIEKGETVGLIGPNGSGKSTLLEILCGTLMPSRRTVKVVGTIGGLLELGAGFNPEFTGRENVYLNAAIFGLSKAAVDLKIQDIEAFADIGEFIDRPVNSGLKPAPSSSRPPIVPTTLTVLRLGMRVPHKISNNVDFPEPLGPISPTVSPFSISKLMPFNAQNFV
jgi:energy-coupling factor transporter ATP-binding protein EcfA2